MPVKTIPFYIVDSFTDTPFRGNPAGVFLDNESVLTTEECAMLCDEVHLESAFVRPTPPDSGADFSLRYFTGSTRKLTSREPPELTVSVIEIPFCGHDTVATAVVLAQTGRIEVPGTVRFVNNVGPLTVSLQVDAAGVIEATLHQLPATLRPPLDGAMAERVVAALGIPESEMAIDLPVQWATTGSGWIYVPVMSCATVDRSPTDFPAVAALSRELDTHGFYVFTLERQVAEEIRVWSRCYAPIAGLNEDPVTGSASGGLGGYLNAHGRLTFTEIAHSGTYASQEIIARQGFAGGRGGMARITVISNDREGDDVESIDVRGTATLIAEGTFTLR